MDTYILHLGFLYIYIYVDARFRVSVVCFERSVDFQIGENAGDRSGGGGNRYNEARETQYLETDPTCGPLGYLHGCDVHLHREVNGQWPETKCAQQSDHIVEERKKHGDYSCENHKRRSPNQSEKIDVG